MPVFPPDHIREALSYDQETGLFIWKIKKPSFAGKVQPGVVAGSIARGYVQIDFEQRFYKAHRLAWWFMTGEMPPKGMDVDHANGEGDNNKWTNLRLATRGQNNWNNHNRRSDNKSGHVGVSWHRQTNKWLARITVEGKIIHLGIHTELADAVAARRAAEIKYCGEFCPKGSNSCELNQVA